MKIERVSENKIRCTLNKDELEEKQILISELAYGSDKARELFSELMRLAEEEVGFEADSTPIMIEAIPDRSGNLILNITKVENPEELDVKFSRFSGAGRPESDYSGQISSEDIDITINDGTLDEQDAEETEDAATASTEERLENLSDFLKELKKTANAAGTNLQPLPKPDENEGRQAVFAFKSLRDVISVSRLVRRLYHSTNSLYKNEADGKFYLYIECDRDKKEDFIKTCSIISEFAAPCRFTYATPDFFGEHFKTIRKANALQILSTL